MSCSRLILLFFVSGSLCLSACEKLNSYTNMALKFVGINTGDKKEAAPDKKRKSTQNAKETLKQRPSEQQSDNDVIFTQSGNESSASGSSLELNPAQPQKFRVDAPVSVQKRVGGVANFIFADPYHIYMDFPQHLAVYDHEFGLQAIKPASFPVTFVKKFTVNDKNLLYVKEENHVLEIFELSKSEDSSGSPYQLFEVKSFEIEANFDIIDHNLVVVFFKDKLQFLDFSDLANIKILQDLPLSHTVNSFVIGKNLFVVREEHIDELSLDQFNVQKSIRIGQNFSIVGLRGDELVLALTTKENHLQGLLKLKVRDAEIAGFGEKILLPIPLADYQIDLNSDLVVGKEVLGEEPLAQGSMTQGQTALFSLKHKKFLRGPLSQKTETVAYFLKETKLFVVNPTDVRIEEIALDTQVIQSAVASDILKNPPTSPPLAQIGVDQQVKDEYTLTTTKKMDFVADAQFVSLLDENHFSIIENTVGGQTQRVFTTTDFAFEDFLLREPAVANPTLYEQTLITPFGLMLYSRLSQEISLLDVDFKAISPLPLKKVDLLSWEYFSMNDKEILMISRQTKDEAKKAPITYVVEFYELASLSEVNLLRAIPAAEPVFSFFVPDSQVVVLSAKEMNLYRWDDIAEDNQEMAEVYVTDAAKKIEPIETASISPTLPNLIAARMSPAHDTVYGLYQEKGGYKITAFDVFDTKRRATFTDIEITPHQFFGASFSKRGRLFILPSQLGTLFYDMTDLNNVREVASWPLPSFAVDLAQNGSFICVALGHKGAYCGKLLF